ncbi:MAG: TIGR04283 family arsenosugar biosynthesis glycosyltransferase [Chitinophagaceae bacterium]|nr:TIGR04283 family arsenosugar biosynthesis glycosyltransferase [Chitinophagaceae bacterium]
MISIIIPTYNEADQIAQTLSKTQAAKGKHEAEIIVVDGGSTDDTIKIAEQCGATIIRSESKGRAAQMNKGASVAKHNILYFLHADSIPPNNFTTQILRAYKNGTKSGCFRLAFDYDHWFLKANAWFTRFNVNAVRYGDQSLFVTKEIFEKSGGFRDDLLMMEDQEIIYRLKKHGRFKVLNDVVTTSARKYLDNGVYRMQCIFYRIWAMYYLGYSQQQMLMVYRRLIRRHKI